MKRKKENSKKENDNLVDVLKKENETLMSSLKSSISGYAAYEEEIEEQKKKMRESYRLYDEASFKLQKTNDELFVNFLILSMFILGMTVHDIVSGCSSFWIGAYCALNAFLFMRCCHYGNRSVEC